MAHGVRQGRLKVDTYADTIQILLQKKRYEDKIKQVQISIGRGAFSSSVDKILVDSTTQNKPPFIG